MDAVFKALQDETRRQILQLLKERDLAAGEIGEHFAISKPSISYHLDLLRQAGLVSSRKEGQFVLYSLETTVLDESVLWILDLLNQRKKHAAKTEAPPSRNPSVARALAGSRRVVA